MVNFEDEKILDEVLDTTPNNGLISPSTALIKQGNDISRKLVESEDPDEIEDLTRLFKLNQQKKNMVRANRLSSLLELVDDEIVTRFTQYPDTFDNDQLVKYMTATQQAVQGIENQLNAQPIIQINNQKNEVHINQSGLDRESRNRVLDAVNRILGGIDSGEFTSDIIEGEIEEKD